MHWRVLSCLPLALLVSGKATAAPAKASATLEAVIPEPTGALDPALLCTAPGAIIGRSLYEGLTRLSAATGEPEPAQAASWEVLSGGRELVFHLRNDLRWSSGRRLTAADFVFAWKRILESSKNTFAVPILTNGIQGAQAYRKAVLDKKPANPASLGILADDERTLRLILREPAPHFLEMLSLPCLAPVSKDLVTRMGGKWTLPEFIETNGPFRVVEWAPAKNLLVKRNRAYWNPESHALERVRFSFAADTAEAVELFDRRKADWLPLPQNDESPETRKRPDYKSFPSLETTFLVINSLRPPLRDPRVRKALSTGLARSTIVRAVLGQGSPLFRIVPDIVRNRQPQEPLQENADGARKLLSAAGYSGGNGFPRLRLLYIDGRSEKLIAVAIGAMVRQTLSINLTPLPAGPEKFATGLQEHRFDLALVTLTAPFNDPAAFLDPFRSGQPLRTAIGQPLPRFDQQIERALLAEDPAVRGDLLGRSDLLLTSEEAVVVPLFTGEHNALIAPRVQNLKPFPTGAYTLAGVRVN